MRLCTERLRGISGFEGNQEVKRDFMDIESTDSRIEGSLFFYLKEQTESIKAREIGISDVSSRSLFSLYFSIDNIANLFFSGQDAYVASCSTQNHDYYGLNLNFLVLQALTAILLLYP